MKINVKIEESVFAHRLLNAEKESKKTMEKHEQRLQIV